MTTAQKQGKIQRVLRSSTHESSKTPPSSLLTNIQTPLLSSGLPSLLRSGWPTLVHPAEPAAAVGLVLRRRLVLGFLDQSQWSHLAAHHDRSAAASARFSVTAASNAAWRRAWVADLSGLVARIRRRVGHGA